MKIKFILPALFLIFFVGWLYTILDTKKTTPISSMAKMVEKGQTIPHVDFKTASGDDFTVEQFKGQPTLVFFTASWCPFCKVGYETLEKALKVQPIRTIGVLYKDGRIKSDLLTTYEKQFDILLVDNDIRSSLKWGVKGLPTMVLLDASGVVVWSGMGQVSEETLVTAFRSACHGQ